MKSDLPNLFYFSEKDVDWVKCAEFYQNNLIKKVCEDYTKNYLKTKEIMKKYNLSRTRAKTYLRRGNDVGWCLYSKHFNTNNRPVEVLKDGQHFAYARTPTYLAQESQRILGKSISGSTILDCLSNKRDEYIGFQFKYVEDIPTRWEIMKEERMIEHEN